MDAYSTKQIDPKVRRVNTWSSRKVKDDDKDGNFAEDLKEGIAFNKSMTYKFPVFEPLAGDIPVSQLESRAVLDFPFRAVEYFAFVTFSLQTI